jgi:hypothetical protein
VGGGAGPLRVEIDMKATMVKTFRMVRVVRKPRFRVGTEMRVLKKAVTSLTDIDGSLFSVDLGDRVDHRALQSLLLCSTYHFKWLCQCRTGTMPGPICPMMYIHIANPFQCED